VIGCLLACDIVTLLVLRSHDGQAGMAAPIGGLEAGIIIAVVTFLVSLTRNFLSRAVSEEHDEKTPLAVYVVGAVFLSWLLFLK